MDALPFIFFLCCHAHMLHIRGNAHEKKLETIEESSFVQVIFLLLAFLDFSLEEGALSILKLKTCEHLIFLFHPRPLTLRYFKFVAA